MEPLMCPLNISGQSIIITMQKGEDEQVIYYFLKVQSKDKIPWVIVS
jgi:hypothetical protein